MKLRKIIIFSLLFVALVTACNEPETPTTQDLSDETYKAHLKKVGEAYISVDSTYEESYAKQIKSEIGMIEDRVVADENLADEDKQNLFRYTTAMLMNIDVIIDYNRQLDSNFLINGKTSGFFTAGIPGAIAGGIIGFSIGIGLSESLMCDWGYAMCQAHYFPPKNQKSFMSHKLI